MLDLTDNTSIFPLPIPAPFPPGRLLLPDQLRISDLASSTSTRGFYLTSSVLLSRPLSCRAFSAWIVDWISASARLHFESALRFHFGEGRAHLSVLDFTNGALTSCPARFNAAVAAAARTSSVDEPAATG